MKIIKYLPLSLAAAGILFSACSSDDTVADAPASGDVTNAYIAVDIQGVGGASVTRAPGAGNYQNGTAGTEGKVNLVRFYFFNSDNTIYRIPGRSDNNNFETADFTNETPLAGDPDKTIESKTKVVIALRDIAGSLPDKIVAVVNPGNSLNNVTINNLDQLNAVTTTANQSDGGFLMSSSVYKDYDDPNGANISYTKLSSSNFKTSEQEALNDANNAAQVYVERVAARVDVKTPSTTGETPKWSTETFSIDGGTSAPHDIYDLGATYSYRTPTSTTPTNTSNIYFVLEGWGLADENNNASVFKNLGNGYNINTNVNGTEDPWTAMSFRRSFWETSSDYTPIRYKFSDYVSGAKRMGSTVYTMPNTPTEDRSWNATNRRTEVDNTTAEAPTKVVLAGRLMTKDGDTWKDAELCRYRGQNYLTEDNVKTAIANDVKEDVVNNLYIETQSTTGEKSYRSLGENDFDFSVVGAAGSKDSYRLEAKLKALGNGQSYCTKTGNEAYSPLTDTQAQTALTNVAGRDIEIYKQGRTYYYTTIQHLWFPKSFNPSGTSTESGSTTSTLTADSNLGLGAFGVVRNHLYQVTINSISGWGTPVYDPDQDIIPVTPSDQSSYLAAQINVLQWREVNQSVDIDGNTITK